MDITIDLSSGTILTEPIIGKEVESLSAKRGDNIEINIQFVRHNIVCEMDDSLQVSFCAKVKGEYAGQNPPLYGNVFEKEGEGTQTKYRLGLSLNTSQLHALFTDEPDSVELMAEVQWQIGTHTYSSITVPLIVANDVNKGTEDPPTYPGSESGSTPLAVGQDYVDVVFASPRADTSYRVTVLNVENSVDENPDNMVLGTIIKENTGFRVQLIASPTTENYILQWQVADV